MQFKEWIKLYEVGPGGGGPGSGMVPPKQDPTKVGGTNAFADYHAPGSDELPPVNKSKKKSKKRMKQEGLWYNDEGAPEDARRKKKPWEERGVQRQQAQTKGAGLGMGSAMGGMPTRMKKKMKKK